MSAGTEGEEGEGEEEEEEEWATEDLAVEAMNELEEDEPGEGAEMYLFTLSFSTL